MGGLFRDPSTLAATGLLIASSFNVIAGLINVFTDPRGKASEDGCCRSPTWWRSAMWPCWRWPPPSWCSPSTPGGISRPFLLNTTSVLAAVVAVFGVIRAVAPLASLDGPVTYRVAGFVVTIGIAVAAATVSYWAARESFLKEHTHGRHL